MNVRNKFLIVVFYSFLFLYSTSYAFTTKFHQNVLIRIKQPNVNTKFVNQKGETESIRKVIHRPSTSLFSTTVIGGRTIAGFHPEALVYMILLALQFGAQPVLTKRFTPKSVNRSTVVMAQEVCKFCFCIFFLLISGDWASSVSGWSVSIWLTIAGIPAALYSIQNIAALMAYQNLDPLTFNVLNQTKTLSAALFCFLIIGRRQSRVQVVSLLILFTAALVIEKILPISSIFQRKHISSNNKDDNDIITDSTNEANNLASSNSNVSNKFSLSSKHFTQGVIPVLLASLISGLAGALVQKNLQGATGCGRTGGRNSYLFSMELSAASFFFLLVALITNKDGKRIIQNGFFDQWTPKTMIPVVTNALGGIIVGLVTKYAGAVQKGFALIFGLLLSGIIQAMTNRDKNDESPRVSMEQILGGVLAALSLWMHSSFPVR